MSTPERTVTEQVVADVDAYVATLDHADASHCVEHLAAYLHYVAGARWVPAVEVQRVVPLVAHTIATLTRQAARRHQHRPGGRPAYSHTNGECGVYVGLFQAMAAGDMKILRAKGLIP